MGSMVAALGIGVATWSGRATGWLDAGWFMKTSAFSGNSPPDGTIRYRVAARVLGHQAPLPRYRPARTESRNQAQAGAAQPSTPGGSEVQAFRHGLVVDGTKRAVW